VKVQNIATLGTAGHATESTTFHVDAERRISVVMKWTTRWSPHSTPT